MQEIINTRNGNLDFESQYGACKETVEKQGGIEILKPCEYGKLWKDTGGWNFRSPEWSQI